MRPAYHSTPDHPTCQTHPLVPAYEASFHSLSLPIRSLVKDAISFRGERHWGPRDGRGGADGRWVDRRGRRYRQRNPRPQKRSTRTSTNLGRPQKRTSVSLNANSCDTRFFSASDIDAELTQWIYQNSMLMSWPETTENTNVLLMTQGFRNDLSFCSWPQKKN